MRYLDIRILRYGILRYWYKEIWGLLDIGIIKYRNIEIEILGYWDIWNWDIWILRYRDSIWISKHGHIGIFKYGILKYMDTNIFSLFMTPSHPPSRPTLLLPLKSRITARIIYYFSNVKNQAHFIWKKCLENSLKIINFWFESFAKSVSYL